MQPMLTSADACESRSIKRQQVDFCLIKVLLPRTNEEAVVPFVPTRKSHHLIAIDGGGGQTWAEGL